jgi:hypothetical protein
MLLTVPGILENGVVRLSELPVDIPYSKVLVTIIPEESADETWEALKLSRSSFDEWDNDTDAIYDQL